MAAVFQPCLRIGPCRRCGKSSSRRIGECIPGTSRGRAHPAPQFRGPTRYRKVLFPRFRPTFHRPGQSQSLDQSSAAPPQMLDWLRRSQVSGLVLPPGSDRAFPHRDGPCDYAWRQRYRPSRGVPVQLPTPSFARAACRFGCTFWSASRRDRDRAVRGLPAIAAGSRSVPATTNENLRRAGRRHERLLVAHREIGEAGSRESKFSPHDRDATHHVGQLLPCRPTGGLTEPAVGCEGECLRRRVLQAKMHALGDVAGSLDVIALYIDDSNGHVNSALRDLANQFNFREFTACHLQMHFVYGEFEKCREQRCIPPQTNRAAFVIAKAKVSRKAAPSEDRLDGIGEDLDEAASIFAVRVAAHGGFIQGDFAATDLHQLLEFSPHNWNQRLGYVPAVFVNTARIDPAA